MKIAGVGVNIKCLPSYDDLVRMAKVSKEYVNKKDAEKLIKKAINDTGLYKANKQKAKSNKRKQSYRGTDNTEQS